MPHSPARTFLSLSRPRADSSTQLSSLQRNNKGQVYYQGQWWTPNKPKPAPRGSDKKKQVLAVKDGTAKLVSFGHRDYQDFRQHKSTKRRANYLARSGGIRNKAGELTSKDRHSANYWARKELW